VARRLIAATLVVALSMPAFVASADAAGVAVSIAEASGTVEVPPSVRAIPATGLWDGQQLELRGVGLMPGQFMQVHQCIGPTPAPGTAIDLASCRSLSDGTVVDGSGQISERVRVHRFVPAGDGGQDCAVVRCHIVLTTELWPSLTATAAADVYFDPDGPVLGDDLPALPSQLDCVDWPTAGWPTGAIPAGVNAAAVARLGEELVGPDASDSLVVIHGGRLVFERYADGVTAETILPSFSMSKSFTSTVIGLLVDDARLALDAPAPVAEWSAPGDLRGEITVRHLLNMSSGLKWYEGYSDVQSDVIQMVRSADQAGYAIARPAEVEPGTRFQYSTGDTMILARIIATTAGVSGDSYRRFLHESLLDPLGIDPVVPGFDGAGTWTGGWSTNTTTRNFAKLGLLYLRHGVWEDEQFVSESWVDFVRSPAPTYAGYGGQFWLNDDGSFSMIGLGGQEVLIVPDLDLIVAVNNGYGASQMVDLFRGGAPATCGQAPAVVDDKARLSAAESIDVDVMANDEGSDIGFAPETLTVSEPPSHGSATIVDGQVRYESAVGFSGNDQLRYVVCTSDRRYCPEATVRLEVEPIDLELAWPIAGATTRWWPGLALPVVLRGTGDPGTIAGVAATPVDCATGEAVGPVEPIVASLHEIPTLALWFWWRTDRSWQGCHELVVSVVDGVDRSARVQWLPRPGW
jgi:CubicO group peptidase (beta-lactamase class C family)